MVYAPRLRDILAGGKKKSLCKRGRKLAMSPSPDPDRKKVFISRLGLSRSYVFGGSASLSEVKGVGTMGQDRGVKLLITRMTQNCESAPSGFKKNDVYQNQSCIVRKPEKAPKEGRQREKND